MGDYISRPIKPHRIRAFKFEGEATIPPRWFIEAQEKGMVFVVVNRKDCHISICSVEGQNEKAYRNHWVCLSEHGKIYALTDEVFQKDYQDVRAY